MGKLYLDMRQRDEALEHFQRTQEIQKDYIVKQLKQQGQTFAEEPTMTKLMEPSIFDDDTTRDLKALLVEVQDYINECADLVKIQPKLDEMKAEAEKQKAENGVDTEVPAGFGLPQADADTFKPIAIKSRKRKIEETTVLKTDSELKPAENGGPAPTNNDENVDTSNEASKRRKLETD